MTLNSDPFDDWAAAGTIPGQGRIQATQNSRINST